MKIRKSAVYRETVRTDSFGEACTPISRVAALAVFTNPFAGRFERDLSQLFEMGREVGEQVVAEALALLESPAVSYGKAALVGVHGDMEHGGAVIHPRLGAPMRAGVGGGAALIPSNVKVAAVGMAIDIPLGHKDDPWSFDHFDTMTIMVPDAPRPDEIVLCVAYADGGRPLPRCGSGPIR
jgi:Amino acid synthesis